MLLGPGQICVVLVEWRRQLQPLLHPFQTYVKQLTHWSLAAPLNYKHTIAWPYSCCRAYRKVSKEFIVRDHHPQTNPPAHKCPDAWTTDNV